ncbi:MAG TPA: type III-B CRISPR module RAMP protein Cmr4 [Hydrogenothermaceae bacterium]|nr:type III-B CRISPR module RAMP protein Cmr4 [Hydrogenothermaceae bacterium]
MNKKKIAFYHCYTPLHIGSGTALDVIDLPIQREAHTDFPIMPSTAIKGVIRSEYLLKEIGLNEVSFDEEGDLPEKPEDCTEEISKDKCNKFFNIFGYGEREGDIIFTDGKILLFPVKSIKGIFAWITCPFILERFTRDTGINLEDIPEFQDNEAIVGDDIKISDKYLVLEELSFKIKNNSKDILKNISECLPEGLKFEIPEEKIAILSNNNFRYFVKNHTEVNARTRIDQVTGTVKEGGLWYEELVPAETVFYNILLSRTDNEENLKEIEYFLKEKEIFQFGGDETLGRGFTKVYLREE